MLLEAQEDHGASAWLLVRACSQNDVCGKALHGETKLACSLTLSLSVSYNTTMQSMNPITLPRTLPTNGICIDFGD